MDEFEKRIAVAKDYHELTGLSSCVVGLATLLWAFTDQNLLCMVVACLGNLVVSAYYRRRYGVVTPRDDESRATRIVLVMLCAPVVILAIISIDLRVPLWTPVAWPMLGVALMLALSCWRGYPHVGATRWHWAIVTVPAVVALLPLAGVPVGSRATLISLGLGLGGTGLVDHLRLVRTLVPVEEQ